MWITPQPKNLAILLGPTPLVLLLCKSFPPGNSISHVSKFKRHKRIPYSPSIHPQLLSSPLQKLTLKKPLLPGIPWWSSSQDSMLPMQGASVWCLVEELRSCMLRCNQKLINKWIKWQLFFFFKGQDHQFLGWLSQVLCTQAAVSVNLAPPHFKQIMMACGSAPGFFH